MSGTSTAAMSHRLHDDLVAVRPEGLDHFKDMNAFGPVRQCAMVIKDFHDAASKVASSCNVSRTCIGGMAGDGFFAIGQHPVHLIRQRFSIGRRVGDGARRPRAVFRCHDGHAHRQRFEHR